MCAQAPCVGVKGALPTECGVDPEAHTCFSWLDDMAAITATLGRGFRSRQEGGWPQRMAQTSPCCRCILLEHRCRVSPDAKAAAGLTHRGKSYSTDEGMTKPAHLTWEALKPACVLCSKHLHTHKSQEAIEERDQDLEVRQS